MQREYGHNKFENVICIYSNIRLDRPFASGKAHTAIKRGLLA